MIFEYDLTIPARTTKADPVSVEMPLARGILHKVEVIFPPGCHHKVFLTINRALHQVVPLNPDGYLKGDTFPISDYMFQPLEEAPHRLEAYGWAPDTTYDHTVVIRLGILPREILQPELTPGGFFARLRDLLFGR